MNPASPPLYSKDEVPIKSEPGLHPLFAPSPAESSSSDGSSGSDAQQQKPSRYTSSRTGAYLEDLSRSVIDVTLNQKDVSHPILVKHMATGFRSKHDALPRATSRNDHHNNLSSHLAAQPAFHAEVFNASSEVDDSRGRATVYLWYGISGLEAGLMREAVAVLSWERRQGLWQIIKHTGMRGPSGFW